MQRVKRVLSAAGFVAFGFVLAMAQPQGFAAPAAPRDTHEDLHSTLWMQTSGEYQALARGIYARATQQIDLLLAAKTHTAALEQTEPAQHLPTAIIMDLDETVIDNSRFQGRVIADRAGYSEALWAKWVSQADTDGAAAIPGAIAFIKYAESRDIRVFYITNREKAQREKTRANLIKLGIAFPKGEETLLTRDDSIGWGSDKSTRRKFVAGKYRVLMLVGDDMNDFVPAKLTPEERMKLAHANAARWLNDWMLLPNAMYGSWQTATFGHDYSLPDGDVLKKKLGWIKAF